MTVFSKFIVNLIGDSYKSSALALVQMASAWDDFQKGMTGFKNKKDEKKGKGM